ncbi:MAG: DUF1203 domain-containing protein [Inquilinus sp.]|nr:DUF1203 domain-containing protein [Inquilinus sp.]
MPALRFSALPGDTVRAYQAGGADANGQPPERQISDGDGVPCRHCLADVAAGAPFLILAHRPFPNAQPYAETGPIFLHAEPCVRYADEAAMPPMMQRTEHFLMRGYGTDDRIVYGTRTIVPTAELTARAEALLARPEIAYLHLRSASNNCYQCRIERG